MSLETEIKKVAINLQQLTDAVTAHTAAIISMGNSPTQVTPVQPNAVVTGQVIPDNKLIAMVPETSHVSTPEQAHVSADLQIKSGRTIPSSTVAPVDITQMGEEMPMTMVEANKALMDMMAEMGDQGAAIRELLASHNALTLSQIPVENYATVIAQARALVTANQSASLS